MKNGRRKALSAFFVGGRSWEAIIWKPAQKKNQHKQNETCLQNQIAHFLENFLGCIEQTNGQMAFQKIPRHISVLLGFLFVKTIQGCRVSRQPDRKRITRKNMLSAIQSYIIYNLQLLAGK